MMVLNRRRTGPVSRPERALVAGLSALLLVLGCGASETKPVPPLPPAQVLRVGVTPNYAPLIFKEDGEIKGIEADLARKFSQEAGLPIRFVELLWADLIPALREGRIDVIMSGMSITADRAELVSFTVPYLHVGQMALIRKDDYLRLVEPDAMDRPDSRVGFQSGTTGEDYARASLEKAHLVGLADAAEGMAALRTDRIDFFLHDAPTVWRTTGRQRVENDDLMGLYTPLTDEYLAWAVRLEEEDTLGEQLGGALLRWQGTGQLKRVLNRWITVRKVPIKMRD
jgi:polar amino acid transport system substrate-binding protein